MKTEIIAHRGASKLRPENTLPAFKLALEQNADGIEGDFHLTKDHQIVCLHDSATDRVAHVHKVVKDSTLAELKKLDVGAWFNQDWLGVQIPTLREILAILGGVQKGGILGNTSRSISAKFPLDLKDGSIVSDF